MPVTRIKIRFVGVYVLDDSDNWGTGEWKFTARIDGNPVGDSTREFEARERQWIPLPPDAWSRDVMVGTLGPGSGVRVSFRGTDVDVSSNDDLGEVHAEFRYPYTQEQTLTLTSPPVGGKRHYTLQVRMHVEEVSATRTLAGPARVAASRQVDGSTLFTTIAGQPVDPRVEVCPVVPVPNPPSRLPQRPPQPAGLAPGAATAAAVPPALFPVPALNALVNPSVIPILSPTDPDFNNRVARLAVTYVEPGDLDTGLLTWHVVSGPAAIVGGNSGPVVTVNGTGNGPDEMAEFEVRWRGSGPPLAWFRAWVGKIGRVPYRMNLLDGNNPASRASVLLTPANLDGHMQVAKVIYWQLALLFEPDADVNRYEGATASGTAGVYNVHVASNNHTRNVNINSVPAATRYNFRPGVINIAYVRSTLQNRAVASDIQGTTGAVEELGGKPSASWVKPSGIPLDAAPAKVVMKTFKSGNRKKKPGPGDKAFIHARAAADATFTAETMRQLYACMVPSNWWIPDDPAQSGVNLAHELGHVLGLRHRGNGDSYHPPRSDDGVNSRDVKGAIRGHPWHENVMTYGYGNKANPPRALDIDYVQAVVVRRHPAVRYT